MTTTELCPLSLHDALPISDVWDLRLLAGEERLRLGAHFDGIFDKRAVITYPARRVVHGDAARRLRPYYTRSEEHTSELQSLAYLVCRLLLEKKNTARRTSC